MCLKDTVRLTNSVDPDQAVPLGAVRPGSSQYAYTFLTYETEFVLYLAELENSVLPNGWDSSHEMLKVMSELKFWK